MKHLVLDINIVLDMWLQRGEYELIDQLFELCGELNAKVWFSSSSLGTVEYILVRELTKEGASWEKAKAIASRLISLLLEHVSLLSNFGYEQKSIIGEAHDLEDAQIALASKSIHGEKRIVTSNRAFDTLGIIDTASPAEALEWIRQDSSAQPSSFVDLNTQQDHIRPVLEKNIHTVFRHGRYILGPEVNELETRLCEFTGAGHCIGVSSGTDALLMPLMAWGIGPGDAVFTTPFTFIATAEVIQLLGATPVFVDIKPGTFNLDPAQLEPAIQAVRKNDVSLHPVPHADMPSRPLVPKAVIPVDLFGLPADYEAIMEVAARHDLSVLSDSAQGFGSSYMGRRSGTLGHAAATSFFPAKPLGAYGEGGAIFTEDDKLADDLLSIRVHGQGRNKYENLRTGLNARLHSMQAAVLLAKLDIFPDELRAREHVADMYAEKLRSADIHSRLTLPVVPAGYRSAWAQYSVLADTPELRDTIVTRMQDAGIPVMIYYPLPLHMQQAFSHLGYRPEDFPVAMEMAKRIFSLPMHPYLVEKDVRVISDTIATILK